MKNDYKIKCDYCGRFIAHKELDKGGGASSVFVPESLVTTEEHSFRCKKCTEEHGIIHSVQNVRNDICSMIH